MVRPSVRWLLPWRFKGPVRPGPSAIWRPFWNRVYPGFHACRQRRSQDRRFIDWRRVSPMSNGKRRNSGSRGRRWSASVCRRMLTFDTTNFDTHIATATAGKLARRGHAKSKRSDLRVVGLAILVSETGHVPLLHRTYPGNGSDQAVLGSCLDGLGKLHDALDMA